MTYIKHCYESEFVGTSPTIYQTVQALEPIDVDGVLVNQWEGLTILNSANLSSSNMAIVEVFALEVTHSELALLYKPVGKRNESDEDGKPTAEQLKLEQALEDNKSDERQQKRKLETQLRQVERDIAKTETIIARKDDFRSDREAKRVELVAVKADLIAIRTGVFLGKVEDVVTAIDTIFENTDNFRVIEDIEGEPTEVKYAKEDCLRGILNADRQLINVIIQAENGINTRIGNHVTEKQRLIDEVAQLQKQLDGTLEEGDNLQAIKAKIETKILEIGS